MRAFICLAALVSAWVPSQAFFPLYGGGMREASQNYYEIITNCDREGGDCIDVDFGGTTDPPPPPPTPRPTTRRPTTRAPLPPPAPVVQPVFIDFPSFFHFFPFWQHPATAAPIPPLPVTTRAPAATTRAPTKTTLAPTKATTKAPGKKPRRKPKRGGENEREVRKRRQADTLASLYSECSGGWEFDAGCSAKGKNVCCYSSSSSNYRKRK